MEVLIGMYLVGFFINWGVVTAANKNGLIGEAYGEATVFLMVLFSWFSVGLYLGTLLDALEIDCEEGEE